jgi:cobalt-zinc-cadmium efflux system membrane fusion protein
VVETGELVAEVVSDELGEAQLHLLEAFSQSSRAKEESEAARSRFAESEAHLENTLQYASVSRERFDQVQRLTQDVRTIGSRELVEAQRSSLEAAKTALEAAVRRDELRAALRQKDLRLTQVQVRLDQRLSAFSVLTGHSVDELLKSTDGMQLWRTFTSLKVRAPARGTVVEVPVSRGEDVTDGAPLLVLLDVTRLRFRGWVPESDLLSLRTGALVQVELPGGMERITTELLRPLPLADAVTRQIRIEADVANLDGILPEGLSATAYVRVAKSLNEEVVVAEACVVRHGLELIVFRRDPKDPGFVVRTPVELGLRAAGKVEVLAGLLAGDSVVQKGIYQLKQTGVGRAQQEGHFHADGSFHDGEH